MKYKPTLPGILAAGLIALTACDPQARSGQTGDPGAAREQPRAPKILTIGVLREHTPFMLYSGSAGPGGSGIGRGIAHDLLVTETDAGTFQPQLATEQVSLEKGTWVINADGTMDTTWRLHQNIKWHDGAPFTSADLVFSATAQNDRNLPVRRDPGVELMQAITAPDPYTFRIHWAEVFVDADKAPGLTPIPRHLAEDLYNSDRDAFVNSPLFTTQWVGLGPYRMLKWELGSHVEYARFNDYYRGRPPLDTVIVRFLGDPRTMVANILAGEVDVLVSTGVDVDAALELKRRWEGTDNQVRGDFTGGVEQFSMQHRVEYARPRNALTNRLVRQGLMNAIDRQALTEVMTQGLAPVAEAWFRPSQTIWQDVESSIPRYPYSPGRSQQLLTEAGWVRGGDGVLVHTSGERFEQSVWTQATTMGGERMISIIADYWKAVGVQPSLETIPVSRQGDREFEATLPGPHTIGGNADQLPTSRLNSRYTAGPVNRWNEKNKGGYLNARFDAFSDRLQVTIDPRERTTIHRELLQEGLGDVAVMLFYWQIVPTITLKGVRTHPVAPNLETWDFIYWDKE